MNSPRSILALLALAAALLSGPAEASASAGPETVLKSYLRAMYARDATAAYALIADADRQEKSLDDYRSETGSYDGAALELSRALADAIEFRNVNVHIEGDRATVTFAARLPDANADGLDPIVRGFDRKRLNRLSSAELDRKLEQIGRLAADRKIPVVQSDKERWQLVREPDGWRVFLNWAGAIEVHFDAVVVGDLGWEFRPLRKRVLAMPGETIQMAYRVRNIGERQTVGKARHIIGPRDDSGYLEIISCFCFLEQALKAGEEAELPLVFRINFDAPESIRQFSVRYEFFPLARFPEGAAG